MSSSPEADNIIRAWGVENLKRTEQRVPKVSAIALKEVHASVLKDIKVELIQSRWRDYLNPSTKTTPFTPEEDEIIKAIVPGVSTAITGTWMKNLQKLMSAGGRPKPQVVTRIRELGLCKKPPKQKRDALSQGKQTKKKQKKQQKQKKRLG
jgi:hypothetical protein